jgi:pyrimidine operon attenuation protein/uracil phosphoribosyltransferase
VGVSSRTVLDAQDIERAIVRISHEIVEANQGTTNLLILGIFKQIQNLKKLKD